MERDFSNLADIISTDENLQPLVDVIEQIMAIPEESIDQQMIEVINGMIQGAFTESIRQESIKELIKSFEAEELTRASVQEMINSSKHAIQEAIDELKPSENKRKILNNIFEIFHNMFEEALEHYHNYNIVLPMTLDEGAQVPTYAHENDAAADLYAADDITVPAHSISNMIRTGVHIALPEGWAALIIPRSSIGAKTGLRLSNSQGLIDTSYRGPLGVIYDNISDSDYEIKKGDRIAQMYIMPVHRFKAQVVNTLDRTDRGEGGFGSTGK